MKQGIYVYGIIKTREPQDFGEIGIGDDGASSVLTVGVQDIAAVVSHSPLTAYDSLSRERVVKDLATHQLVIESAMQRFTVLPVKFGTMVETEDDVLPFLENGAHLLHNELNKVQGKIELDVVAWWDLQKILTAIARQNEQIQAKQQEIAMKGDQVSAQDKLALGQLIAQALKAEEARYQQVILQTLKQEAVDVCMHEVTGDKMIFNSAFLLEKSKEPSFDAAMHSLDQRLESTVNFRVVGPLPPYSFSTIVFKKLDPESIEAAKKTLGLTGDFTEKTLRDAYHQLAQKYHPDKTGEEDSAEEFQQIHDAYNILKDLIEHRLIHVEVYRWQEEMQ
jgi:hypothetical protein